MTTNGKTWKRRYGVLLSTEQMATLAETTRKTIRHWINKGLLKAINLPGGGGWRVHRDDFRAFLEKHKYDWAIKELDARIAEQEEDDDE